MALSQLRLLSSGQCGTLTSQQCKSTDVPGLWRCTWHAIIAHVGIAIHDQARCLGDTHRAHVHPDTESPSCHGAMESKYWALQGTGNPAQQ